MATENTSQPEFHLKDKILQALKKHAYLPVVEWASDSSKVCFSEVGDGNLNDVFRAYPEGNEDRSVVVKHAPPYIKCLGKEFPLSEARGSVEYSAQCVFDTMSPGSVPKSIFYDDTLRVICMEDLRGYKVYRNSLISGDVNDSAALKLAKDVALIHRGTHRNTIGEDALKQMDVKFQNTEMISLTERYVFTGPFSKDDPTNKCSDSVKQRLDWVYGDEEVTQAAANMKKIFLERKEALIHGDLHTGSVMVKGEDSRIIDCEFAYVGPCSFDIGVLVANYIFTYYCHIQCPENNDDHRAWAYRIVDICTRTVEEYFKHMTTTEDEGETFQASFMSDVAGFAGCEIIRRILGVAHVAEFDHTPAAEVDALGAGVRLLKAYRRINSIGTLVLIALMLA